MKSRKEERRRSLARVSELQALESQLEDPLPPLPERFARSTGTSPPHTTNRSMIPRSRAAVDFSSSHAESSSTRPTLSSNMIRLDARIGALDDSISGLVSLTAPGPLVFAHEPKDQDTYHRRRHESMAEANVGHHALELKRRVNQHFLLVESKLCSIFRELESFISERMILDRQKIACEGLLDRVENALVVLDTQKEVEWHRQRPVSNSSKRRVINSGSFSGHWFSDEHSSF